MAQDTGDLLHDRQAQAQPAILLGALHITAPELLEHFLQVFFGDADAAVPHLDPQAATQAPATQHHPPAAGVTDGIAEQVAQNARQQLDITAHHRRTPHEMQGQALATRDLGIFGRQVVQQLAERERRDIGLDHARIKFGNVDQGAQQALHILQRVADIADQLGTLLRFAAFQQRAGEQPRRIQRLQQIMADRSQKLGFRQVGLFGLALGFAQPRLRLAALFDFPQQLVVEAGQLRRALTHPLLQVLIGLVQCLRGIAPLGDIADQHEDTHHLAAGQAVGDIGAQHVALLALDVGFGKLEGHALARQCPRHIGLEALVVLFAVGLAQALPQHHATRPAVPFLIHLVGEFIDQVGIEVGDQRRNVVGDQANLVLVRGLGPLPGLAEQVVHRLQLGHGLAQRIGALAHLLGQHHRMLKRRVRVVAAGDPGLDTFDQRTIDALQLMVLLLQPGHLGLQVSDRQEAGCGQWRRR